MATAIQQITNGVHFLAPELILVIAVCVMFLTGPFFVTEAGVGAAGLLAAVHRPDVAGAAAAGGSAGVAGAFAASAAGGAIAGT